MKKIMTIALLALLSAPAAQAATTAPASADATFQQEKQKSIAHAGDKIAEWQKKQACAQAAATQAALDVCFPKRGTKKTAASSAPAAK